MSFPAETCIFLQKNAFLAEKMAVFGGGHMAGNHRKFQEGFRAQESRTLANFHKIFGGHIAFLQHAPQKSSASKKEQVKRSGPESGPFAMGPVQFS